MVEGLDDVLQVRAGSLEADNRRRGTADYSDCKQRSTTFPAWRFASALTCACLLANAAHGAEAKGATVKVAGSSNIGIGVMSGGQLNIGLKPEEVEALHRASAKESLALLEPILKRVNAQIAQITNSAREEKIALGVAEAFLATIKGKKIPTSDWSVEFGAAARSYLRLGASIQATPITSGKIKDLVTRADAARKSGKFDSADLALAQAAEVAIEDARQSERQAMQSKRQASTLYASRAHLAFTRLERSKGALLLEQAYDLRSFEVSSVTLSWLIEAGNAWLTEGNTDAAMRAYGLAHSDATEALASDPSNPDWQRALWVCNNKLGEVQSASGDTTAATRSFMAALSIAKRLAASDPLNLLWQRDLAISHVLIGDIHEDAGDSEAALKSFEAALAIQERLAAHDSLNAELQSDRVLIYGKLGSVQAYQGDTASALASFKASLAIAQRLAATDSRNLEWQRAIASALIRVGDGQSAQGDANGALSSYRAGLAIAERLVAADPRNTGWQRDLSVAHFFMGDLLARQGNSSAAIAAFQAALVINERLAARDPLNTEWQRDCSVGNFRIGQMLAARRDFSAALKSFQAGLSITARLADKDQLNAQLQRDLAVLHGNIGEAQSALGDKSAALASFQANLVITERLADSDPRNAVWQRAVVNSYWNLASLGDVAGSVQVRRSWLKKGRDILLVLRERGLLDEPRAEWLDRFESALRTLQ